MHGNERSLAYALLRIAIGVNIAGHGLIRLFYIGLGPFAQTAAKNLSKSPLPHGFVLGFLYIVPIIESIMGISLVLGIGTRFALVVTSALMICLTFGVASNQQWDTAATQLLYSFVLFALLFLVEYNDISLDRALRGSSAHQR